MICGPETSAETLWLTFSLLSLEPVRQVEVLGGLPSRANADERALLDNGASHLLSAIQQFHAAWIDEFDPCPVARQLFDLAWSISHQHASLEEFLAGESWRRLRELAKAALREAGLEPWPVPEQVDFHDYLEIVSPDDYEPFIDHGYKESEQQACLDAANWFSTNPRNPNARLACFWCRKGPLQAEDEPLADGQGVRRRIFCPICASECRVHMMPGANGRKLRAALAGQ